jgi:hypothetical protein
MHNTKLCAMRGASTPLVCVVDVDQQRRVPAIFGRKLHGVINSQLIAGALPIYVIDILELPWGVPLRCSAVVAAVDRPQPSTGFPKGRVNTTW